MEPKKKEEKLKRGSTESQRSSQLFVGDKLRHRKDGDAEHYPLQRSLFAHQRASRSNLQLNETITIS